MPTLNALLDKAKETRSLPSDMALAEALHVSRSAVSLWRKGERIKEEHLTALVTLAGADPATALQVMAEQATTRQEKAVWGGLLQRFAAAGMHIMSILGLSRRSRPPAQSGAPPE